MNVRGRAASFCAAALAMTVIAYGVNDGTAHSRADAIPVLPQRNPTLSSAVDYRNPDWLRALVHRRVKHVFVLVQENHTFDNYFGLYPGQRGQWVENLGSPIAQADDCVPDPWGGKCQRPFLLTTNKANAAHYVPDAPDITDGDNDRFGQQFAIDGGKMDGFLVEDEAPAIPGPLPTALPSNAPPGDVENHNEVLGIESTYDCDTIPYLWDYAKNFTLFDHYFEANAGDSTPANVQLFAAQIGQTEVAAGIHPFGISTSAPGADGYSNGLPLGNDNNPPPLQLPFLTPYSGATAAQSISVASLPVLLNPWQDAAAIAAGVEGFIPGDLAHEAHSGRPSFPWAWYEEGSYASDGAAVGAAFSPHHDAPLYFDYINHPRSPFGTPVTLRDNTVKRGLISDIRSGALPSEGVFWVKGGAHASTYGFQPSDPKLATIYVGDDDHPGTNASDHQVAEAYVATVINAIATSKYWKDSVIILTWDDSGGMYDHLPPPKYGAACPDDVSGPFAGTPCGDGVRLPLLLISPFAKHGAVIHAPSNGGSIAKFIEDVFDLPKLAFLPNEITGTSLGVGPADVDPFASDLTAALDIDKLRRDDGWYRSRDAFIPAPSVPPAMNCASLGITPLLSPGAVPRGFETTGWYAAHPLPAALQRARPRHSDTND